jgi:outer membrane protein assembly factor BamB
MKSRRPAPLAAAVPGGASATTLKEQTMMRPLVVALLASITALAHAENWPAFRGPSGDGHAVAKNLPTSWSESQNVTWKVEVPGEGWSSPSVVDGKIYLTTAVQTGKNDYDRSLRLLCLDATTGKTLWDAEAFTENSATAPKKHGKASHANPTPIVEGDRIYIHFGHLGTAAFDLAGKVIWKNETFHYTPQHGNGGSPILVDNLLVFSVDGIDMQFIVALDKATGKEVWKTPRNNAAAKLKFSFSTPTLIDVKGVRQIVSPSSEFVMAYDPKTGKELWRVQYPGGYSVIPKPVFNGSLVYACSGYNNPVLYAIRPTNKGDITKTNVAWSLKDKAVPHTPSLLLVGEELYMVADKGIASCVDQKTGKAHWTERVGGNYSASPIYADGKIYFQSEEGKTTVLKPGKKYEVIGTADVGERTLASMAIVDSTIFLRGEKHLFRIEQK